MKQLIGEVIGRCVNTGDVYYLVTSAEPGATGAFSTGVEVGSPSNGGYLKPAGLTPSFGLPSHYEIVE
ncbi:MAG: hypothetical protein LJE91_09240 [Gammaproteobacteria bacterium]|nr:hypothetical protein [Gammaproteobacteria bacterium]